MERSIFVTDLKEEAIIRARKASWWLLVRPTHVTGRAYCRQDIIGATSQALIAESNVMVDNHA
jgi:hypothetical protein